MSMQHMHVRLIYSFSSYAISTWLRSEIPLAASRWWRESEKLRLAVVWPPVRRFDTSRNEDATKEQNSDGANRSVKETAINGEVLLTVLLFLADLITKAQGDVSPALIFLCAFVSKTLERVHFWMG